MIYIAGIHQVLPVAACAGLALTTACAPMDETAAAAADSTEVQEPAGEFQGAETEFLDDDLIQVIARVKGGPRDEVSGFADCVAAHAATENEHGYFRQIRTTVAKENGLWVGDAVYVISVEEPEGLNVLVAADVLSDCSDAAKAML